MGELVCSAASSSVYDEEAKLHVAVISSTAGERGGHDSERT